MSIDINPISSDKLDGVEKQEFIKDQQELLSLLQKNLNSKNGGDDGNDRFKLSVKTWVALLTLVLALVIAGTTFSQYIISNISEAKAKPTTPQVYAIVNKSIKNQAIPKEQGVVFQEGLKHIDKSLCDMKTQQKENFNSLNNKINKLYTKIGKIELDQLKIQFSLQKKRKK